MKFYIVMSTALLCLCLSGTVRSGGPFIDTSSIFGADKLSEEMSEEFREEMQLLLDYLFREQLNPFMDRLNNNLKDGVILVDEKAKQRIDQINLALRDLVKDSISQASGEIDLLQRSFLSNAEKTMGRLQKSLMVDLAKLNQGVFMNLGCEMENLKSGIKWGAESDLEQIYERRPEAFDRNYWIIGDWLGADYADEYGCYSENNISVSDELTPINELKVFACTTDNLLGTESTPTKMVDEYYEVLRVAGIHACKYRGKVNVEQALSEIAILQLKYEAKIDVWSSFKD